MKIWFIAFLVFSVQAMASLHWDDGVSHTIDSDIYQDTSIYLDNYPSPPVPGTHVDVLGGGVVHSLGAHHFSTVNITGGQVRFLTGYDNSVSNVSGGTIHGVTAGHNASITIAGGDITGNLAANRTGTIYLYGTGFEVYYDSNVFSLSHGDRFTDFAYQQPERFHGYIRGTLADGTAFDAYASIPTNNNYGADIIIIPEPTTLLLLGLGGLLVRKR